jgi:heme oxygenase
MITTRLKEETRPNHEHTEEIAYSKEIMSRTLTKDEYTRLLKNTYLIHNVIESQVENITELSADEKLALAERRKTHLISKDLEKIGVNSNELTEPALEFKINSVEEALGALYVLEGSTLGGMYIYKALQRNPNLEGIEDFHYYNCYGEATRDRWAIFQDTLLKLADSKEKEDAIIENAKRTFDFYSEVFSKN